jgi:hypothetical protein
MTDEDVTLYTDSNFQLLKTNKVKGLSMELLIRWTFNKIGAGISHENSISQITKEARSYMEKVYRIKKNFSLIKQSGQVVKFGITSKDEDVEIILDTNIFTELCELEFKSIKTESKTSTSEEWDGKWSKCSQCGKFATTEWLKGKKKKCWVCKRGFFNKNLKLVRKNREIKVPYLKKEFFSKFGDLLAYLKSNEFITPVTISFIQNKSRVDLWRIIDGNLIIYESKNKEKTQLHYKDMIQALIYGVILKKANLITKHIDIIFNGYWEDWFINVISKWLKKYDLQIKLIPIKKWLIEFTKRTNTKITYLLTCPQRLDQYGFESISSSDNSKWWLNIYLENSSNNNYEKLELCLREKDSEIEEILQRRKYKN